MHYYIIFYNFCNSPQIFITDFCTQCISMAFCIDQGLKYAIFGSKQAKPPHLTLIIAKISKKSTSKVKIALSRPPVQMQI